MSLGCAQSSSPGTATFVLVTLGSVCRGDPDTAARGGHQVQNFPADSSAGGTGGGVPGLLQRTLCPAHQADPKHSHCLVHLRVNCVSLGGPRQVAEPSSLYRLKTNFFTEQIVLYETAAGGSAGGNTTSL